MNVHINLRGDTNSWTNGMTDEIRARVVPVIHSRWRVHSFSLKAGGGSGREAVYVPKRWKSVQCIGTVVKVSWWQEHGSEWARLGVPRRVSCFRKLPRFLLIAMRHGFPKEEAYVNSLAYIRLNQYFLT